MRAYLPALRLADERGRKRITVRQLLCHVSGINEDLELYLDRDDRCVQGFVAACGALLQLHLPGALFSNRNSGIVIAEHLVETLKLNQRRPDGAAPCLDPNRPTLDRLVDHLDHAVQVMGIEHVGFGGDFIRQVEAVDAARGAPSAGETMDASINELAGNMLRFFREAVP